LPLKTKEIDNQTNDAIINLFFICPLVKNKTKTHLILSLFVLLCIFVYRTRLFSSPKHYPQINQQEQ